MHHHDFRRFHRRTGRTSAVVLGAALCLSILAPVQAVADQHTGTPESPQTPESSAILKARQIGSPVAVVERQNESTDLLANPDGSFTWRQHVKPIRAKVNGQWTAADATLERRPDGAVAQKASTFPMTFSGGGTGPLATMVKDGKELSLSWPGALPSPELNGATALYRDVIPGVDLKVLAEADGFSHHLVVNTREAAADPRLTTVSYGLKTKGITLAGRQQGGLAATDNSGRTVFSADAPTMWDSRAAAEPGKSPAAVSKTPSAASAASLPPAGADGAGPKPMQVKVDADSLRLTPDPALLRGADTVFPVVIDPTFTAGWRNRWAVIYSAAPNAAFPNGSGWNSSNPPDEPRVGYNGTGITRSYFEMNTQGLNGSTILSATFHVEETHSWGCDPAVAGNTELWTTSPINVTTPTWNNKGTWHRSLDADAFAHGNPTYCPGVQGHDFTSDALREEVQGVANRGENITLGLLSSIEEQKDNYNGYKRFRNNPYLEVTYNRPPVLHDYAAWEGHWTQGSASNVNVPCISDPATWPTIGRNDVVLTARISDPDGNPQAKFEAWNHNTGQSVLTTWAGAPNEQWASTTLSWNAFQDGGRYKWHVQAEDGLTATGFGRDCGFNVDGTPPTKPTVSSADGYSIDNPEVSPRIERKVKLASSDQFGLTGFCYSLNKPLPVVNQGCGGTWVAAGPDGSATISIIPTLWPVNKLTVQAMDKAGNLSPYDGSDEGINSSTTTISTAGRNFVRDDPAVIADSDRPGDLTGDGHPDLITADSAGELKLYTGRGDGTFDTPRTTATPGWSGAQISHRGDFASEVPGQTKDGYEDYFVKLGTRLYLYPGNGMGAPREDLRTEILHPTAADWSSATQILAAGNLDANAGSDLLVKEGDKLVLYSGTAVGPLATATGTNRLLAGTTVSTSGWNGYDVLSPGDVNGDGIPDLLARRATADTQDGAYGQLRLVPGARNGSGVGFQVGTPASGTVYASGFDAGRLPLVTSPGNVHGTVSSNVFTPTPGQGVGDLLATTPSDPATSVTHYDANGNAQSTVCPTGCMLLYPGTPSGLGLPRLVVQGSLHMTTAFEGGNSLPLPTTAMTRAASGSLVAAKVLANGSLWATNQAGGGYQPWYQLSLNGANAGNPALILSQAAGGTVHIFARTTDGRIVDHAQQTSTSGFATAVAVGTGAPVFAGDPSVITSANGGLLVSAIDTAGDLWISRQPSVGAAFGPWSKLSTSGGLTGRTASVLSAVNGGTLFLYVRTTDGHIGLFHETAPGGGFSTGQYLAGDSPVYPVFAGAPSVTTAASGGMIVAAVDVNGDLWAVDQAQAGGAFRSWYRLPTGGMSGATDVVLSAGAGGTVNIVARTTTGRIALFGQADPTTGFGSAYYLGNQSMVFASDPRVMLADNGAMTVTAVDATGTTWAIDQANPGEAFRNWYYI